jgi:hypothetical protein
MQAPTNLFTLGAVLCLAQASQARTNKLRIYTAIEVESQTELGKACALQGSRDPITWVNIDNPVLGNGQVGDRIFSTQNADKVNDASYRRIITPGPTNGCAPWSIAGLVCGWMIQIRVMPCHISPRRMARLFTPPETNP